MPNHTLNQYNDIAEEYQKSDTKPDKLFSILPTVLHIAGDLKNKIILDLGCGDGFFTRPLAEDVSTHVFGIDNSEKQIELAKTAPMQNIQYILGDIFIDALPNADIINVPFVLNYCQNANELSSFFRRLYDKLNTNGKVIFVYDLPTNQDLKRFGAQKKLTEDKDGAAIEIDIYNNDAFLCTLYAIYFKTSTIKELLEKNRFQNIAEHRHVISKEGEELLGEDFWKGYEENCELGYITAEKL